MKLHQYTFLELEMSVITDKTEVRKILRHLCKIGREAPGVNMADLKDAG